MTRTPSQFTLTIMLIVGIGFLASTTRSGVAGEGSNLSDQASGLGDLTDKAVSVIAPLVDPGLIGSWQRFVPAGPGVVRLQFDIRADGTYKIWSDNPTIDEQIGSFAADAGIWDWSSPTGVDGGRYDLSSGDIVIITGRSGPVEWERVSSE